MRFGKFVASATAAVMMLSTSANAATIITQNFSSTFARYGSTGPALIGSLNLVNQVITSAVVSYQAGQTITQTYPVPTQGDNVTFTYSGRAGFDIFGPSLQVPVSVVVPYSGTVPCVNGRCGAGIRISGDYIVPEGALAALAGTGYINIAALVGFTNRVNGSFGDQPESSSYASGTITYLIADVLPVPEPATWTMMILGLGLVGYTMRRRAPSNVAPSL